MRRTKALRELLERVAAMYNDGKALSVEWGDHPHIGQDGTIYISPNVRESIGRTLSPPNELRVLTDDLSHEVEHARESDLTMKETVAKKHADTGYGKIAGSIMNIVEDVRIDYTRTNRFRGMRAAHAFWVDAQMQNAARRGSLDSLPREQALVEGLLQVSWTGGAKGVADLDAEVREYLARSRVLIKRARHAKTPAEREAIADRLFAEMLSLLPPAHTINFDDFNEFVNSLPQKDGGTPGDIDEQQAHQQEQQQAEQDRQPGSPSGGAPIEIEVDAEMAAALDAALDAADMGAELGAIDAYDDTRESGEWHDVPDGVDYDVPDASYVEEYVEIRQQTEHRQTDLGKRKERRYYWATEKRDELDWNHWGATVEKKMQDSGLAEEIRQAFAAFRTADRDIASEEGHEPHVDNVMDLYMGDLGQTDLYWRTLQADAGDRTIGVLLDASGSMYGRMASAKQMVAAVATAADEIGDNFIATSFRKRGRNVDTQLITAPDEEFEFSQLDAVHARGGTPMLDGLKDIYNLIEKETTRQKVIVAVHDGKPSAADKVAKLIKQYRQEGIIVIGVGVGGSLNKHKMERVFGPDGYVLTTAGNLTDTLIGIYKKQLDVDEETRSYM